MVRKTTKMLKKLNKNGVKFDGKKKKFFASNKRKPISKMDCYNCGELDHLAHQLRKPKKDKYRRKTRARKMTQVMRMMMRRRKTSHTRRRMARTISTRKRKMARHTSSVIGSRILIHQVAHPMMIVRTRRWPLL